MISWIIEQYMSMRASEGICYYVRKIDKPVLCEKCRVAESNPERLNAEHCALPKSRQS